MKGRTHTWMWVTPHLWKDAHTHECESRLIYQRTHTHMNISHASSMTVKVYTRNLAYSALNTPEFCESVLQLVRSVGNACGNTQESDPRVIYDHERIYTHESESCLIYERKYAQKILSRVSSDNLQVPTHKSLKQSTNGHTHSRIWDTCHLTKWHLCIHPCLTQTMNWHT